MKAYQRYESGRVHRTNYIGGGSDHEGQIVLLWIIVLVVLALVGLVANYGLGQVIAFLVTGG